MAPQTWSKFSSKSTQEIWNTTFKSSSIHSSSNSRFTTRHISPSRTPLISNPSAELSPVQILSSTLSQLSKPQISTFNPQIPLKLPKSNHLSLSTETTPTNPIARPGATIPGSYNTHLSQTMPIVFYQTIPDLFPWILLADIGIYQPQIHYHPLYHSSSNIYSTYVWGTNLSTIFHPHTSNILTCIAISSHLQYSDVMDSRNRPESFLNGIRALSFLSIWYGTHKFRTVTHVKKKWNDSCCYSSRWSRLVLA